MFKTIATLISGTNAAAEERLRDRFSIALIDQKIREAEAGLKSAKLTLASLIQRQRSEQRHLDTLVNRIADLTSRAQAALADGRLDLAEPAAKAIADLENEASVRQRTVDGLEARILKLRHSVDAAHRRLTDLKQGAIAARAAKREATMHARLGAAATPDTAFEEAETLIATVLSRDDPFEAGEILREINDDLDHGGAAGRLADAGYGPRAQSTAADVLARLQRSNP